MNKRFVSLQDAFQRDLRGGVRADAVTRRAYATDASMYQIEPLLVVEPLDQADLQTAVQLCARHQLPLLARGGGTSLVGQSIGSGVVLDVSRHCTRVVDFHPEQRTITVEPGLVRDELNRFLKPYALHFAPDPATTSRATVGGMVANNAAGMRSIQYGMTIDHIRAIDLLLADGERITLGTTADGGEPSAGHPRTAALCHSILRIVERERAEIEARFPRVGRRSGGYALDALTGAPPLNFAKLIAGSEGTLGVIASVQLNLEPLPAHSGLCLAHFGSLHDCLRAVAPIMEAGPSAVELLDGLIVRMARRHPLTTHTCHILEGEPEGVLVIEARSDDATDVRERLTHIQARLRESGRCYAAPIQLQAEAIQAVWTMRESALGLINTVSGDRKPVPYIEDAAVPPDRLPEYIEEVMALCARHQQPVALFAHAGAGLLHIRPLHNLRDPDDRRQMLHLQDEVFARVQKYGGSWSGEHGDGIIRGHYNRAFFGDRLYHAFREIKTQFDPEGRLNPGKKLDTPPRDQQLRVDTVSPYPAPPPAFHWKNEGTLLRAVEQCTGIGACRKVKSGVMCPSYMATRDEIHSTRGRANILRQALSGTLGPDAFARDDVLAAFDLCLSCKGCKSECPNQVDVGKLKAELQHQYYQHHRRPLRDHLWTRVAGTGGAPAGRLAGLANAWFESMGVRKALDRWMGLDARRPLPPYAREPFSHWFRRTQAPAERIESGRAVVLFIDVYTEHFEPGVGQAAVRVLEASGYRVIAAVVADSQRPALSMGLLDRARVKGGAVVKSLLPYAEHGWPILVLEPSAATALLDELPDLVDDSAAAATVAGQVYLLEYFLADEIAAGRCTRPPRRKAGAPVFFHPHCHQRSIDQGRSTLALLQAFSEGEVRVSPAGCCGMAGAFGYEKEHYALSVQIARDRLLPALEPLPPDTIVVANGFSCRRQIKDLTARHAMHLVEWIALGKSGSNA